MNLAPFLLEIVSCPQTQQKLTVANGALLEKLNAAIDKGKLKDASDVAVSPRVHGALVRSDGEVAYPVWDDIPRLVAESAIALDQLR